MSKELWKKIRDCPFYRVSNLGRVKSLPRMVVNCTGKYLWLRGRLLKPGGKNRNWYLVVVIYGKTRNVHQLVAEAFLPPRPPGCEINHKNGKKWDCRASNLEWKTHKQNMIHSVETGLRKRFVVKSRNIDIRNPYYVKRVV